MFAITFTTFAAVQDSKSWQKEMHSQSMVKPEVLMVVLATARLVFP
jgi:hypothetical protein